MRTSWDRSVIEISYLFFNLERADKKTPPLVNSYSYFHFRLSASPSYIFTIKLTIRYYFEVYATMHIFTYIWTPTRPIQLEPTPSADGNNVIWLKVLKLQLLDWPVVMSWFNNCIHGLYYLKRLSRTLFCPLWRHLWRWAVISILSLGTSPQTQHVLSHHCVTPLGER